MRGRRGWAGWMVTAVTGGMVLAVSSAEAQGRRAAGAALEAARAGGVTLLCRHAITDSFREVEPVDYADTTTQRLLSPEGARQSRDMGRAFRAIGVTPVEVVASPMSRARRTAELMFDAARVVIDSAWHTNGNDFTGPPMVRRAAVLAARVVDGVRIIISHIGTMRSALDGDPGDVEEGDCVVVRPEGDGHHIVGVVPWRRWLREAGNSTGHDREGRSAQALLPRPQGERVAG